MRVRITHRYSSVHGKYAAVYTRRMLIQHNTQNGHFDNTRYSDIFFKSLFKAHNIHHWKEQKIYIPAISYVYSD